MLKLLFVSTSIGQLGSGLGGGVELTLTNMTHQMQRRGHGVTVIAPQSSFLNGITLREIPGNPQISAQSQGEDEPIVLPENSILANMWDYARQIQGDYDLIVNFAYDWLPFYLTPFFPCPVAHLVSMAATTKAMDRVIRQVFQQFPRLIAFHSVAQSATFGIKSDRCLGNGIDLSLYDFEDSPGESLAWVGRISPEKALEDALAAVQVTRTPLKIFGTIAAPSYWDSLLQAYPDAPIEYRGFLPTHALQKELGKCQALLMTNRWVEAFGNVAIEALACGVPVITYRRGGPGEIVRDQETGFLVEPDSVSGLIDAIAKIGAIARYRCREQAEREFSVVAFGDRVENWFQEILS